MFNSVGGFPSASTQSKPVGVGTAPPGLPDVPADLDFGNSAAVRDMHQSLMEAPALQRWCEQTFDGVDMANVRSAVASLILHKHATARQARADAIPDERQAALVTLAPRLSPTGNAELRHTLDTNAAPQGGAAYLADSDRLCLVGRACHRDADAQVCEGHWASAARDYATAARAYAQVAGQEAMVEQLDRLGAHAQAQANQQDQHLETKLGLLVERVHKRADQPEAAAPIYMKIGMLAFERHKTLDDDEARKHTLQAAADAFAAASAAYTKSAQPMEALDADLKTAHALDCGLQYKEAAARFNQVAQGLREREVAHRTRHETALATIASQNAEYAAQQARTAEMNWLLYRTALISESNGQDEQAAKSYEHIATLHWRAGQPVQAGMLLRQAQACHRRVAQQQMSAAQDFAAQGKYTMAGASYAKAEVEFRLADQLQQAEEAKQAKQLAYARGEAQAKLFAQLARIMGVHTTRADQIARASGAHTTQADLIQPEVGEHLTLVNQIQQVLREFQATLPRWGQQLGTHRPSGAGGT